MRTHIGREKRDAAQLPDWARPGKYCFARLDGGPMEVSKGVLSNWYFMSHPDCVEAVTNLYSDDTIDLLDEAGINWVWVTWSVGFSLDTESRQREILTAFMAKCHRRGIHVYAYMSLCNMFWADMFKNEPRSREWVQIDARGKPIPYGAAAYVAEPTRYMACLNHPGWIRYLKRRVDLAIGAGVDGICYDNLLTTCRCKRCLESFRRFTRRQVGREYEVPTERKVRRSMQAAAQGREGDLLADASRRRTNVTQLWEQFGQHTMASALRKIRVHASKQKGDILIACNAHERQPLNDACNALFTEDGREPGIVDGQFATNIELLKELARQAKGWKPVCVEHGLRKDRFIPMSPRRHQLCVAESAAFGASFAFSPEGWFVNQLYRRDKAAIANCRALGRYHRFLKKHERYYSDVVSVERPQWRLDARGSKFLVCNVVEQRGTGKTIVHVLNYGDRAVRNVRLNVDDDVRRAWLLSPDGASPSKRRLVVKKRGNSVTLTLPRVDVYGVVIAE